MEDNEQKAEYCEHCGAKLKKNRFAITKAIAQTLIKLRRAEVALGKREIWLDHDDKGAEYEMTKNQRSNMSRLRILGLARYTEAHSGRWFITRRGYQFLRGEEVPYEVWTFRNEIVKRTDKMITLQQAFKNDEVPYFNPITDRDIATEEEMAKAAQQRLL